LGLPNETRLKGYTKIGLRWQDKTGLEGPMRN